MDGRSRVPGLVAPVVAVLVATGLLLGAAGTATPASGAATTLVVGHTEYRYTIGRPVPVPGAVRAVATAKRLYVLTEGLHPSVVALALPGLTSVGSIAVSPTTTMAVSPDGRELFVGQGDQVEAIATADLATPGYQPTEFTPVPGAGIDAMASGPGDTVYIASQTDGGVVVDVVSGTPPFTTTELGVYQGLGDPTELAVTSTGVVYLGGDIARDVIYPSGDFRQTSPDDALAMVARGNRVYYAEGGDAGTELYADTTTSTGTTRAASGRWGAPTVSALAVSPDGRFVLVADARPYLGLLTSDDLGAATVDYRSPSPWRVKSMVFADDAHAYAVDENAGTVLPLVRSTRPAVTVGAARVTGGSGTHVPPGRLLRVRLDHATAGAKVSYRWRIATGKAAAKPIRGAAGPTLRVPSRPGSTLVLAVTARKKGYAPWSVTFRWRIA